MALALAPRTFVLRCCNSHTDGGRLLICGSRAGAAHIREHAKHNVPLNNIHARARENVKTVPNTLVLQECQHKSRQNHVVFQYNMLQMFCPRSFLEIIREPLDFKACAQITRSHLTSRYTRVGLACAQGMTQCQIIPYHAGHRNPYIAIDFLSSLRYSSSNTYEHQLAAQQRLARFIELQSAQFLINGRVMGRLLFKGARPGVKKILV